MSLTKESNEALWHAERSRGLGGSDLAAIIVDRLQENERAGCQRKSLTTLWATKAEPPESPLIDPAEFQDGKVELTRGHTLEAYLDSVYSAEHGVELYEPGLTWHPTARHIFGTGDRLIRNQRKGVEFKTRRHKAGFGAVGTTRVPIDIDVQCRVYMEVYDADEWDVFVAFSLDDFRLYTLLRDRDVGTRILALGEEWWARHVVGGDMPEVDEHDDTARLLAILKRDPEAAPAVVKEAADEDHVILAEYRNAEAELRDADKRVKTLKNRLRSRIGEAEEIAGVATWKTVTSKPSIDLDALQERRPKLYAQLLERFPKVRKPYRKLDIIGSKGSESGSESY